AREARILAEQTGHAQMEPQKQKPDQWATPVPVFITRAARPSPRPPWVARPHFSTRFRVVMSQTARWFSYRSFLRLCRVADSASDLGFSSEVETLFVLYLERCAGAAPEAPPAGGSAPSFVGCALPVF